MANKKIILYTDDDVHMPKGFRMEIALINGKYQVIVYPIRAISKDGVERFIVGHQDMEYVLAGAGKKFQDAVHGVLYHHGAVYACTREFAFEIFFRHTTDFIAEDIRGGLIKEELGKRAHISNFYFATLAPNTYLGTAPNKLNQRMRSWNFGAQTLTLKMLWALLTQWPIDDVKSLKGIGLSLAGLANLKYNQIHFIYTNIMDWLRVPMMGLSLLDGTYWYRFGAVLGLRQAMYFYFNYVHLRKRPDLQQPWYIVSTKFLDDFFEYFATALSLIRYVLVYIPNYKPKLTIPELDKRGDFDYIRELNGELPGYKYLTHVRIPTRLYSGFDEVMGRWELVMKAATQNNIKELETRLEKAAVDLTKQAQGTQSKAKGVALFAASAILLLLIAKILLNVLEGFRKQVPENTELSLDMAMPMIGVVGALIEAYLINSVINATNYSRIAKISSNRLALFHQPAVTVSQAPEEQPQLKHRSARPSLQGI